jgi:putative Holliday junction resolvase
MDKILGLDLGTKRLGIAISDVLGIAHPLETFHYEDKAYKKAKERVVTLIKENNIKEIALGLPLNMSGSESEMSDTVRIFKEKLMEEIPDIKVELVDERLTSVSAHRALKDLGMNSKNQRKVVDMIAAQEILDTYIRMKK